MKLEDFAARARAMWEEIPPDVREGGDVLSIAPGILPHPEFEGIYTLGECVTDEWPSSYGGAGDTRSELVLHYGSFAALAEEDAAFDWEGELWETLLHELLHHREAAAGQSGLESVDWAEEQNFRRLAGEPFDPEFCQAVPVGPGGVRRLDSELFVESTVPANSVLAPFEWRGSAYTVRVPPGAERIFVSVINLAAGRLCVVVRRTHPWWRFWRRVGERPDVVSLLRSALPLRRGME